MSNNSKEQESVDPQASSEVADQVEAIIEAVDGFETKKPETIDADPANELQEQLARAQAKADENWDKYVRLQAELDNVRRRNVKQLEDAHKFGARSFAESMLPVIDSIEMGLTAEGDLDAVREGMALTLKVFQDAMNKNQVKTVNPEGEVFNPELHQAVSMFASEEHENNTVVSIMQKGYTLNGRLIRPAMVVVCKK
ncbi:MAG: nucleotide exchange factor GrpE [Thiotrichaceae bacterium]|nr:nucleotide exchange factor GrpE [Thiotrichaceae bacterium]